jgi:hypothetical protein
LNDSGFLPLSGEIKKQIRKPKILTEMKKSMLVIALALGISSAALAQTQEPQNVRNRQRDPQNTENQVQQRERLRVQDPTTHNPEAVQQAQTRREERKALREQRKAEKQQLREQRKQQQQQRLQDGSGAGRGNQNRPQGNRPNQPRQGRGGGGRR